MIDLVLLALLVLSFCPQIVRSAECSVKTCTELGWTNYDDGDVQKCAERDDNPLGDCQEDADYTTALTFCGAADSRLCTYAELFAGAGVGTGCGSNANPIWSSDGCIQSDGTSVGFERSNRNRCYAVRAAKRS